MRLLFLPQDENEVDGRSFEEVEVETQTVMKNSSTHCKPRVVDINFMMHNDIVVFHCSKPLPILTDIQNLKRQFSSS
jgi:hypothetical protein